MGGKFEENAARYFTDEVDAGEMKLKESAMHKSEWRIRDTGLSVCNAIV